MTEPQTQSDRPARAARDLTAEADAERIETRIGGWRLVRLLFWAAFAFTFAMAVQPHPPELPGQPNDKLQHILAFSVLTAIATGAFPAMRWWQILIFLSACGALIEIVQAVPILHRSSDWLDWLADTGAVAVTLALVSLVRWTLKTRRGK